MTDITPDPLKDIAHAAARAQRAWQRRDLDTMRKELELLHSFDGYLKHTIKALAGLKAAD